MTRDLLFKVEQCLSMAQNVQKANAEIGVSIESEVCVGSEAVST